MNADATQWVQYAIRYDAPAEYAGVIANVRETLDSAEGFARQERRNVHVPGLVCTVVQRTVTVGEWSEVRTGDDHQ